MTAQSFNEHFLVDYVKLISGDSIEIERLQHEFESNGWCFIRLPDQNNELVNKLNDIKNNLSAFFDLPLEEKVQYESSCAFGYLRVHHKEGIKVLTNGQSLCKYHEPLPNELEQHLQYLAVLLHKFTSVLQTVLFQMPIVTQSIHKNKVPLSAFSMLDIVNYFNEKTVPIQQPNIGFNTNEVNCVPHFDPGLFSLSILSTCDGLQLKDITKDQWIDGPNNEVEGQDSIGVIWLGEAASIMTGNQLKSGIHRVVYPRKPHQPRLTIWQEVCTKSQINTLFKSNDARTLTSNKHSIHPNDLLNYLSLENQYDEKSVNNSVNHVENERMSFTTKSNYDDDKNSYLNHDKHEQDRTNIPELLPGGASITMTNQPNSEPLQVELKGETLNHFMKRIENERGLSMSKSGVEHLQISFPMRVHNNADETKSRFSFFSKLFKWKF